MLEFLDIKENIDYLESDLEKNILNHLKEFLLELGKGFTYVGNQVRITLDIEHYYPDLVFYNRILKCFVIIDLKIGKVTHKDIGQMQMYVNYYDREIKSIDENKICSAWFVSTPAGARNMVLSKYAGGLLISVAVINLSSLYVQIPQMVIYKLTGNHTGEAAASIMILLFSFLIIAWALEMPFCFRFSTKYGSYIRTALVIVLFTALAIYGLFFAPDNMLDPIFEFFLSEEKSTGYYFFMNGIPLISLLLYYISYRISCRAYLKGAEELG